MKVQRRLWLVLVLCVLLVSIQALAQDALWKSHLDSGKKALEEGDYATAQKQFLAALQEAEDFGPQDSRLATTLNNLAVLYHTQGKYSDAEPLYRRALAIREKSLGPKHPDVATSLNNLAEVHRIQGKYADAEPLYRRSLAILEESLGPEHPIVARLLKNYAALLRKTNREADATKMEARSEAIRTTAGQAPASSER